MKTKQDIRAWVKEERKNLDIETLSEKLVEILQKTSEYNSAKNIMLFYPKEYEINLLRLLKDKDKNFYLPKIDGKNLLICPYKNGDELCVSCFNTKEPISDSVDAKILDLVIVPALAVDKNNYRLGYGCGYYDRFLQRLNCCKIVCINKEFVIDTVFPESFDVKFDKVITA